MLRWGGEGSFVQVPLSMPWLCRSWGQLFLVFGSQCLALDFLFSVHAQQVLLYPCHLTTVVFSSRCTLTLQVALSSYLDRPAYRRVK